MGLFDAYLFVDWSAANRPSPVGPRRDAIWVGELGPAHEGELYCRSRREATGHLRGRLRRHVAEGRRVLVGFDFPFGYPEGFAALIPGGGPPWQRVWRYLAARVVDSDGNVSNRFAVAAELNRMLGAPAGPFWGCGARAVPDGLTATRPFTYPVVAAGRALREMRATDAAMRGVQPAWKLSGVGSVGSQALVGIPRVAALRDDPELAPVSRVWPFETGFTAFPTPTAGPFVVYAEIWPGVVDPAALRAQTAEGMIRDGAQMRVMCRWAEGHDAAGTLGGFFGPVFPDAAARDAAEREEGWILGALPDAATVS